MSEIKKREILVVAGLSGAGKMTVAKFLEDEGWYTVRNLPVGLLENYCQLLSQGYLSEKNKLSLTVELMSRQQTLELVEQLRLCSQLVELRLLLVEAGLEDIVCRYRLTRREHPLEEPRLLTEKIQAEQGYLEELKVLDHELLDTSGLSETELVQRLEERYAQVDISALNHQTLSQLSISEHKSCRPFGSLQVLELLTFGFKYGIPLEADYVIDVRLLENPYWRKDLRGLSGKDEQVYQFVISQGMARKLAQNLNELLGQICYYYGEKNKKKLLIAIGCTGGKHRSVAFARYLRELLQKNLQQVTDPSVDYSSADQSTLAEETSKSQATSPGAVAEEKISTPRIQIIHRDLDRSR